VLDPILTQQRTVTDQHRTSPEQITSSPEQITSRRLHARSRHRGRRSRARSRTWPPRDEILGESPAAPGGIVRQGQEQLAELSTDWPTDLSDAADARATAKHLARQFVHFCTEDAVRYQLLFQRVIPGWEPTQESYELALARLDELRRMLASLGIASDEAVDLWTAILTGLTDQQISNDPGGDGWSRLTARAVDMFFDHLGIDDPGRP
jgi:hypothetical protein